MVASCRTRSQFSCSSWCSKHSQLINNVTHRDTDYTITTAAGEHPASSITGANSGGLSVTPRSPSAAGTRSSGADGRLEIHARREPLGASEPVTGELREPPRWVDRCFLEDGLVQAAQHQGSRAANVLCSRGNHVCTWSKET